MARNDEDGYVIVTIEMKVNGELTNDLQNVLSKHDVNEYVGEMIMESIHQGMIVNAVRQGHYKSDYR